MPASHRTFARTLALAVAATLLVPAAALAAPETPTPPPTPRAHVPTRAEIERIVERAQGEAREAIERAEDYARQAQDRELLAQRNRDLLADLDYDLELPALAFIGSEFGVTREIVKNAPYTADAVTESIQFLQDDNRIVKRSTTKLARDTYGRTRQEKEGPRGAAVYIFDPIDNRNYVLNPQKRTATRIPRVPAPPVPPMPPMPPMPPHAGEISVPPATPVTPVTPATPAAAATAVVTPGTDRVIVRRADGASRSDDVRVEVIRIGGGEPGTPQMTALPPIAMPLLPAGKGERKSLGTREFDGVRADGTQTTQTIPAGEIGNEKPIVIVSERWFSPELQLVVFARTRDPRSGETTYRLNNLKRGEPPADLFRVPADYRARESRG
jgi:hypothetical protein